MASSDTSASAFLQDYRAQIDALEASPGATASYISGLEQQYQAVAAGLGMSSAADPTSGSTGMTGTGTTASSGSAGQSAGGTDSTGSSSSTIPAWAATTVYTQGNEVTENGATYAANWWTQGNDPASNNGAAGTGEPWTQVSSSPSMPSSGSGTQPGSTSGSSSGSSSGTGTTPPATTSSSAFSPYVDVTLFGQPTLAQDIAADGSKNITAAFLTATDGGAHLGWGGMGTADVAGSDDDGVGTQIAAAQAAGGNVTISIGGANGTDPATVASSASAYQAELQGIIDRYHVTSLDFDIEGSAQTNTAANQLRDQAAKALQAANPGLQISYTLPVEPTGLTSAGEGVITQAAADGFTPNTVNVMAMDYGSANDNLSSGGSMGQDAIDAATATHQQLQAAGLNSQVGITPMIGVNDTNTEVFSLNDAQSVLNFANSTPWVGGVSFWSLGRDNGSGAGEGFASATSSGLSQDSYAFSKVFDGFNHGTS